MSPRIPSDDPAPTPKGAGASAGRKVAERIRQLRAASLGWNFAAAPLVGGAMGYGVDWLLGSYPWAMVVGVALGFVSAFIEVLRSAR
ncbi:MAG: AtpZ/AtpI family protein [Nitrospinota bacterium]